MKSVTRLRKTEDEVNIDGMVNDGKVINQKNSAKKKLSKNDLVQKFGKVQKS